MIDLTSKTAVLVEDDAWQAELFIRQLKISGMQVWHERDPATALRAIDEHKPDVIVADLLLSGSTGLVLFHELQSHSDLGKIPIVVVSSVADSISIDQLQAYGVKKIIDKLTMTPDDLPAAIRGAVA